MGKIRRGLRKVRAKLSRAVTGLSKAERRVKHHKQREHHWAAKRDAAPKNDARRAEYERKRKRAHDEKRKWQKRQTKAAKKRKYLQLVLDKRMREKAKWLDEHPQPPTSSSGTVHLDGHDVAAWIANKILIPARNAGVWNGYVISGWRDPAYSESLCYAMCGAPSCSGTCAGRSSAHSQTVEPEGAVDLSDPGGAVQYAREHGIPFHGNGEMLPSDKPHCSTSGH